MGMKCPKCHFDNPSDSKFCKECGAQLIPSEEISISHTETLEIPMKGFTRGSTVARRYKVIEELGRGGMGVVYKARDTKLKRNVALKFLSPELIRNIEAKERFIHEAQTASALDHPNIFTVYEIDETEGQMFIAMAYIEGQSLSKKIKSGPLKLDEALDIAIQVAEGLHEAHEKGIVHRDIKSANIMLTEKGQAKIMDFGLAKLAGSTLVTKEGTMLGTVAYMSPEQARGETVDHRTDIWSLGVVMYEMLTGQRPFKGEYEQAVVYSILNVEPEPMKDFRNDVPIELEQIVSKNLAKSSDSRYLNVRDMLVNLRKAQKELESMISKEQLDTEKRKPSIAVLPFRNMSADPEQEYFCDGMAEEIINALTHVENMCVIARTSAFAFKDKHEDVREIGKKLDVETLLEGSVRKAGNRLRITAQLVKVADGSHLWSERYDRDMEDVFAIQDEISLAVVDNLKVKLLGKEKASLLKRYTEDIEAYNLYLKGNYYWQMLTIEGFDKAIECFEQAFKKDPHYALAYTGLASVYWISSYFGNVPPNEAYPKAKEYAKKALEIDNTLAEAHASLGIINMNYDWNWKVAEREFKQALQLNPNYVLTHMWYSFLLIFTERNEEAIAEAKRSQELDPISVFINTNVGLVFLYGGRYDEAIEVLQMTIAMNPNYFFSRNLLGLAYRGKSMIEEAIAEYEKAFDVSGGTPRAVMALATTYYEFGEKAKADKLFDSLKQRQRDEYVPPTFFYFIHLARGDQDQAFEWLERAYNEHDSFLPWFRVFPIDRYRIPDEPRFTTLLKKIGLEK